MRDLPEIPFASVRRSDFAEQWTHFKSQLFVSAHLKAPYRWRELLGPALCALRHRGKRKSDLSRVVPQHPDSSETPLLNPLGLILKCSEAHLLTKNRCQCVQPSLSNVQRDGQWSVTTKLHIFTCRCSTDTMPCSWDPVRAAVQWHCWEKPFHSPTSIPWKPPLSLLKHVGVSAWPQTFSHPWLELFQRKQSKTKWGLYIAAPSLSPAGDTSSWARSRGGGWRTSEQQNQQPLQQSPALFTPQWGAAVRHKTQLLTFPEILWRGSDSCRWDREIQDSQEKSGILETAIFKRWAKYL